MGVLTPTVDITRSVAQAGVTTHDGDLYHAPTEAQLGANPERRRKNKAISIT